MRQVFHVLAVVVGTMRGRRWRCPWDKAVASAAAWMTPDDRGNPVTSLENSAGAVKTRYLLESAGRSRDELAIGAPTPSR
jgi:hypothetical protein